MTALDYKMKTIDGKELDLAGFKGKVVLFVNVASECGYTGQYAGLQKLHESLGKDGLVIVGVPSNEFGSQEPGTNADIKKFCETNYKVTFPLLAKVVVKGAGQVPLYKHLTSKETTALLRRVVEAAVAAEFGGYERRPRDELRAHAILPRGEFLFRGIKCSARADATGQLGGLRHDRTLRGRQNDARVHVAARARATRRSCG